MHSNTTHNMNHINLFNQIEPSGRKSYFLTMQHVLHRVVAILVLALVSVGTWAQWTDANGVTFTFVEGSAGYDGEGPENVCDGEVSTKFCGNSLPCYVIVEASLPVKLTGYSLWTANDTGSHRDRNPRSWTIEGSMDGSTWTQIVIVTGNTTMQAANNTEYDFTCTAKDYYKYFRLTVSDLYNNGTTFQFSEFHPKGLPEGFLNGYVFISNETSGYFLNSSAQATQTFNESTCVWSCINTGDNNAATLNNNNRRLRIGTGTSAIYLDGANSNSGTVTTGTSRNAYWRSDGTNLYYYRNSNRQVYRDGTAVKWNGTTNPFRVYTCTKIAGGIDGSISGADYIYTTGTSENYSVAASYTDEYYMFSGPDTRYYADGYEGATTTKPSGTDSNFTYSNWTLEGADGYATVNSTTGVVTYSNLVPEGSRTVTLKCTATHTSSGKSVVLTKEIALINENIPTQVYLDPSKKYGGNDSNPGTKEKPVLTWKKAYSLLNKNGTVYNNYIILMSEYTYNINNDQGLATFHNETSYNTYEKWKTQVDNVGMNVPATITSYLHDNDGKAVSGEIDYTSTGSAPARYNFGTSQHFLFICADTRFEWLSFYGHAGSYEIFFAQYFNVEFGHGLKMSHFKNGETYGVLCKDSHSADFQIFGGMNNDARFKSDPRGFEEHMPHAKEGFKMVFRSGYFSNVCAGGRQADSNTNGVFGTPRLPIKAQIIVDIDREWNDANKTCITSAQGTPNSNLSANYDIGMLLAGNHEGCMYGDVDLIVLSGYVARVVNGILGARRAIACTVGTGNYPYNAYMGRANALMDPSKMVDVHGNIVPRTASYSDESAYITELYGGGLGRPLQSNGLLNLPVYGKNTVTINGGTIGIVPAEIASNTGGGLNTVTPAVFGGASGGVNGIGDDASRTQKLASDLTNEERLPYWMVSKEDGSVAYGDYNTWKTKNKVQVHCYNVATNDYTDIDLQYASTQVTINGGTFGTATRPIDGIYGGGSGYINGYIYPAATDQSYPFSDAGTLYGKPGEVASNLTINGGTFYCNIYGAGRGTDEYYSKQMYDAAKCSRYTALAKVYGDVQVNINGGTIYGNVYGGGAGFAELKLYNKTTYGQMTDMARLTGNSTVNIRGNATVTSFTYNGNTLGGNVYGGGMLAGVTGTSTVNVAETATVTGDVYAAAQGIPAVRSNNPQTMPGTNKTYILNTAANNILFGIVSGNTTANINGGTVGGNIFGGAEAARCGTNTSNTATVNINSSVAPLNDVYGGGELGDVQGNTAVNLLGGTVHDVYGGGLGSTTVAALVQGNATVTLNGSAVTGNIFGANNLNGTPKGHVLVDVKATATKGTENEVYHVAGVYGGGNLAAYVPTSNTDYSEVVIEGCENSIEDVFGGGNAAAVPATLVTVWGGDIGRVFAGGNGSSAPADVTNGTQVIIHGGTIKEVYGGSNTKGSIGGNIIVNVNEQAKSGQALCPVNVSDLYGGGNLAASKAGQITIGKCTNITRVFGGANQANVTGPINLSIVDGNIGTVFGGNNNSGTVTGAITVTVNWNGTENRSLGNVYGGGNLAEYTGSPTVNIINCTTTGSIFGGGLGLLKDTEGNVIKKDGKIQGAIVVGNPVVNIGKWEEGNVIIGGDVFGGGDEAAVEGSPTVTLRDCGTQINGNLYGGGNAAPVYSTNTTMWGGTVKGNVFGGGNGADAEKNAKGAQVGYKRDDTTLAGEGLGNAITNIYGGTIGDWQIIEDIDTCVSDGGIFGGSNTRGNIAGKVMLTLDQRTCEETGAEKCTLKIKELYGSGNEAAYAGTGIVFNLGCVEGLNEIYGGAKNADMSGDIHLIISSGHFKRVFGGNNMGGCINGNIKVSIDETGCNPVIIDELFCGGNQAAYSVYGYNTDKTPKTSGEVLYDNPQVEVISCTHIGQVFGGGLGASAKVVGTTNVLIDEIPGDHCNTPAAAPYVNADKLGSIGDVFGGGNAADVVGDTNVKIGTKGNNAHIGKEGASIDVSEKPAGVNITGNVYGGGSAADVTGKTYVTVGRKKN